MTDSKMRGDMGLAAGRSSEGWQLEMLPEGMQDFCGDSCKMSVTPISQLGSETNKLTPNSAATFH